MDAKIKTKWVKALRGGRYRQTSGALHSDKSYCCLGVLCRVVGAKWADDAFHWKGDSDAGVLPVKLRREMKITPKQESRLIGLNDGTAPSSGGARSFKQIADYIERYL